MRLPSALTSFMLRGGLLPMCLLVLAAMLGACASYVSPYPRPPIFSDNEQVALGFGTDAATLAGDLHASVALSPATYIVGSGIFSLNTLSADMLERSQNQSLDLGLGRVLSRRAVDGQFDSVSIDLIGTLGYGAGKSHLVETEWRGFSYESIETDEQIKYMKGLLQLSVAGFSDGTVLGGSMAFAYVQALDWERKDYMDINDNAGNSTRVVRRTGNTYGLNAEPGVFLRIGTSLFMLEGFAHAVLPLTEPRFSSSPFRAGAGLLFKF